MRVLFLLDKLGMGGAERNTVDLMQALARSHVEPYLCILGHDDAGPLAAEVKAANIPLYALGSRRLGDPIAAARLLRLMARGSFDVVHVEDPYAAPLAALARYAFRTPVVITRHVLADDRSTPWNSLRATLLGVSTRLAGDRGIVLASALKPAFADQTGMADWRMAVVSNGIQPWPDRAHERDALRLRLGWRENERIILFVAVLRGGKGHEDLFAAMPQVLAADPNATVKVVGDGPARAQLEALARPLGGAVTFLGERRDVAELMAAADLLVLPSWSEAYPTVLLEAAMAGLPSVASDVGGAREIVVDGITGLIVPPKTPAMLADAIIRVLSDPPFAARLRTAARARALDWFTVERQAAQTLAIYRQLVPHEKSREPDSQLTTPAISPTRNASHQGCYSQQSND